MVNGKPPEVLTGPFENLGWTKETGLFAFEVMLLKREKSKVIEELKERGKELQIVCRKIKATGGKATKKDSEFVYIIKGSFEPELFNPEIGRYETDKCSKELEIEPALTDELEQIHKLTYGYYGTELAQLSGQFETLCKTFWKQEKEETNPIKVTN